MWTPLTAKVLGERVRARRLDLRLSRRALGERAGLSENQIYLIEAGRGSNVEPSGMSNPKASSIFAIAEALWMDPADLLIALTRPGGASMEQAFVAERTQEIESLREY